MTSLYGRNLVVTVAGLTISELRMLFDLKFESSGTPGVGWVSVFNLSRNNEKIVFDRAGPVTISGGYGSRPGLLFAGSVDRVERSTEQLARITRIYVEARSIDKATLSGITLRSYAGAVPVRRIAKDLVADFGMEAGPLDAIGADSIEEDWEFTGTAADGLTSLLQGYGVFWFEDSGTIRFNRPDMAAPDAEGVPLSPDSGLIGAPTIVDEGTADERVKVRSLLNSKIRVGNLLQPLKSERVHGNYKIVAVRHHGSNYDGPEFYSEADCRKLDTLRPIILS